MSTSGAADEQAPVVLEQREEVFHTRFLQVIRGQVRYRRADGRMSDSVERLAVEHGNAVGVLIYDPRADTVALVRQFRFPVYEGLPPEQRAGAGARASWLLEVVAGICEAGQGEEATARRELREEVGFEATGALERIATVYPSPGNSTERITLFLAEVQGEGPRGGGGLEEEGEDTNLVTLPRAEALDLLRRGEIQDAKTVIALQYLALRPRQESSASSASG